MAKVSSVHFEVSPLGLSDRQTGRQTDGQTDRGMDMTDRQTGTALHAHILGTAGT